MQFPGLLARSDGFNTMTSRFTSMRYPVAALSKRTATIAIRDGPMRDLSRLAAGLLSFASCKRGNVAMMFAVMLPVLLTSVGMAIDYSRAANARSAMQAAVDSTALMISKDASGLTSSQITTKARGYFDALFTHPEITGVTFTANYTANSGTGASVKVDAAGTMPTDFMKLAGIPTVDLDASSTTKWGNIRYRIALALDNTKSMDSANKMTELKKAATALITEFYNMASADADVYISIVPFSRDVNIGTSNKSATWLRWTEWDANNGSCSGGSGSSYKTKTACQSARRTWTASNHNNWTGCVMDRDQNYDTTGAALANSPTGAMAPAEQYSECPSAMLGMTPVKSQKAALLNKINAMDPIGATNQSIGMFWAGMTLQASGPFTGPAKDSSYGYQDVIILMTDGLNTENRWESACTYWNGVVYSCDPEPAVDARQALLCANAKATGMKVFAIQVATDNDPVSSVTKSCASDPNNANYFSYITQASQMTVKFQNIFKELAKLRIAA
jgi:Flp pilus assembly protein TadG